MAPRCSTSLASVGGIPENVKNWTSLRLLKTKFFLILLAALICSVKAGAPMGGSTRVRMLSGFLTEPSPSPSEADLDARPSFMVRQESSGVGKKGFGSGRRLVPQLLLLLTLGAAMAVVFLVLLCFKLLQKNGISAVTVRRLAEEIPDACSVSVKTFLH